MKHFFSFAFLIALSGTLSAQRIVPFGVGIPQSGIGRVHAMRVWDGKLVVAGNFSSFLGNPGESLQAWDGTQFYTFPGAFETPISAEAICMEVYNGQLVVGGSGASVGNIAGWDGTQWQTFDQGYPQRVRDIAILDDQLVIAGDANTVCRWNGSTWDTLGVRFDDDVDDLAVYQGQLYASGWFNADAEGNTLLFLARWNGTAWEQVSTGLNERVETMEVISTGLAIGGRFTADGSEGQPLPYWTVFDGTAFSVPSVELDGPVFDIHELATGALLLRGFEGGLLLREGRVEEIPYGYGPAVEYDGMVLLGKSTSNQVPSRAEAPINALVQLLLDGVHEAHVDIGTVDATVSPTPSLFSNWWDDEPGFEAPKGDSVHAVYGLSPWLYGKQDDAWHSTWSRYALDESDSVLWAGPSGIVKDSAYYRRYHQVWLLRQEEIDHHAQHFADEDYIMPWAIASWPGNGNTANGEAARLAPFADVDGNELYEPASGDYPLIRGEQAAYWMLHGELDEEGGLDPLRFDMYVMVYAYGEHTMDEDLRNTVFTNFRVINRSGLAYDSLRFGIYGDIDLGDYNDDLAECDTTRNLFFAYNADDDDTDIQGIQGYGAQPPSAGIKFLNQQMTAHRAWHASADPNFDFADGINGTLDGQPFTDPGYATHFQYPGGAWSDVFDPGIPERRAVGSAGPFTWNADDTLCFDVAVIYDRAASGGPYASAQQMKQRADRVQLWYDAQDMECARVEDVVAVREWEQTLLGAFPNPVCDNLTLVLEDGTTKGTIVLYDATGNIVSRNTWPAGSTTLQLDLRNVQSGFYVAELISANERRTVRVVKMQ